MALIHRDIKQPDVEQRRAELWQKRLAYEMKCAWRFRRPQHEEPPKEGPVIVLFRSFLKVAGLYDQGHRNALSPVVRELELAFNTTPGAFDGFRILHLSDFHFANRPEFLDRICRLVDGIEVDLCVLTGDFRFNSVYPCRLIYGEMHALGKCLHARLGTVAILGNNDSGNFRNAFGTLGIRVLVNDSMLLNQGGHEIGIAGVDDPHYFRCDALDAALAGIPDGTFTILLAHSPEMIPEAAAKGVDLYLCGHTHGGQMCLPLIGPVLTHARCPRRYASDCWRYGDMQGYTTRGLGTAAMPLRFHCPPEAALITLRASNSMLKN